MKIYKCLDLFCGAGGAAAGYHRAGFEVTGVDNKPQHHYPFRFIQYDAMKILSAWQIPGFLESIFGDDHHFDLVHLSPPCQGYSWSVAPHNKTNFSRYIDQARLYLSSISIPYVLENVFGARSHMINPLLLCGSMFCLPIRRHRLFELSPGLFFMTPHCSHPRKTIHISGSTKHKGLYSPEPSLYQRSIAMGIDWMTDRELSEAIPPAYTEFIGEHMIDYLISIEFHKEIY